MAVYLRKRGDLLRYFTLRLKSAPLAEDVVQDIGLRLASIAAPSVENPGAYLYRLGTNLMLDRLKQQRRAAARDTAWQAAGTAQLGGEAIVDDPAADAVVEGRQRLDRLLGALDALPAQRRRAFVLHKLEGLSHAQTAERMGVSRSAVEKHIIAALQQLVALLAQEGGQ